MAMSINTSVTQQLFSYYEVFKSGGPMQVGSYELEKISRRFEPIIYDIYHNKGKIVCFSFKSLRKQISIP